MQKEYLDLKDMPEIMKGNKYGMKWIQGDAIHPRWEWYDLGICTKQASLATFNKWMNDIPSQSQILFEIKTGLVLKRYEAPRSPSCMGCGLCEKNEKKNVI